MAHSQKISLVAQGTDAVFAAPNSIPLLIANNETELMIRITMAVNFLRCGNPAVQILVHHHICGYRKKFCEAVVLIEDTSTETLSFDRKDGYENEYDIFLLSRSPTETPPLAPIEHNGQAIRELND